MKNFDTICDLSEIIDTVNSIRCTSCKTINNQYDCDVYDAGAQFYNDGWRLTKHDNVYCPKCSKKKLKTK